MTITKTLPEYELIESVALSSLLLLRAVPGLHVTCWSFPFCKFETLFFSSFILVYVVLIGDSIMYCINIHIYIYIYYRSVRYENVCNAGLHARTKMILCVCVSVRLTDMAVATVSSSGEIPFGALCSFFFPQ